MRTRKIILLVSVLALALILSANMAYGATATAASVWTTDELGNHKLVFDLGETIYIHWLADGTVDITAEFENGTIDGGPWTDLPSSGTQDFDPTMGAGIYKIKCTGAQALVIAYGTAVVIPQLPFGTILATIACFAALGVVVKKKRF